MVDVCPDGRCECQNERQWVNGPILASTKLAAIHGAGPQKQKNVEYYSISRLRTLKVEYDVPV
jgi:hypothetical protein